MTDRRLRLASLARQHLRDIERASIRKWGIDQTADYLADINETMKRLCRAPEQGRRREDIGPGYRSRLCGRHLIYYRFDDTRLYVTAVLHERMDIKLHF